MVKSSSTAQPERLNAPLKAAISRRGLIGVAGAGIGAAAAPLHARSFGTGFTHGVASGEPGARRVLLWTRYAAGAPVKLEWEVSESADFTSIAASGDITASPTRDGCVKPFAAGLNPGTWYYYRFIAPDGAASPVGRTRTLPEGPAEGFKLAVFSCSNYGFGWFNAYAHAAQANDTDLAVHLGDYIYEYGAGTYPSPGQTNTARGAVGPANEVITLADYRLRYAAYRSDPDLQRLHQVLPMIAIWDDHESANDSWEGGAQNHQADTEGEWQMRKAIAKQVYREWMPVSDEPYAAYDVGDLATLFRLDTRLEGREEQFSIEKLLSAQTDPEAMVTSLTKFAAGDYLDPDRQMLGAAQETWLTDGFAASKKRGARWQVLVQQVLMGKVAAPQSLFSALPKGLPDYLQRRLDAGALARQAGLPLNMDAWDGYPAARSRLFAAALNADANLIVLAGDTHNAWNFDLAHDGMQVGTEFGVSSVSSPGFEGYLSMVPPDAMAGALVAENPELQWADTSQRGYMVVELSRDAAICEWRFMEGIETRSAQLAGTKRIVTSAL